MRLTPEQLKELIASNGGWDGIRTAKEILDEEGIAGREKLLMAYAIESLLAELKAVRELVGGMGSRQGCSACDKNSVYGLKWLTRIDASGLLK